jgi:DNA replication protein DnaC
MKRKLTDRKKICPRCSKNRCRRNGQGEFIICESCENASKVRKKVRQRKYIREHLKESIKEAGLPLRHKDADMEEIAIPVMTEDQNCFFIGNKGLGKTYTMVAMASALIAKGHQVKYATVPELLLELKSAFNRDSKVTEQSVLHKYSSIPYLFLDDIGVEKTTDYVLQALFIIIDRRYMDNLHLTISSNLSLQELSDHGDARLVSRLVEMCDVFEFSGKDRRIK